ncbi:MAG: glutathione S-transferase family protein [Rhodospirillales bacterium]|nr:glutathione S-transferase family protein [Rhodospirillales bacterium]
MAKAKKTKAKSKAKPRSKARPKKAKKLAATATIKRAAKKSAARAARGALIGKAAPVRKARPAKDRKLVLHGLYLSMPACKVGLMLSMLGAKWDYKHVDLRAGAHRAPEFLAINRFAQVPVLRHGDECVVQSNVILEYLADAFGKFGGRTPAEKRRIAEWLAWDFDRMATGLGMTRGFTQFFKQEPPVVAFTRQRGEAALDMLDRHLGASKFVAGTEPTIADIAIFPWVATAEEGGFDIARWPNVRAWAERFMALPGAAHPYTIMPKEDRAAA